MNEPIEITVKAKLLSYKLRDGYYILVFENMDDYEDKIEKYFWIVIPPRWKDIVLEIGEVTMLNYVIAKAGQLYYDSTSDSFLKYKSTINWYRDSIPLNHVGSKKVVIE